MTSPADRGPQSNLLRFDSFELDIRTGELRRGGVLVKLQQQPFKVLVVLARRSGELVTREEMKHELWSDDTFVDFDQGLNFCIKQVRAALKDQADTPRYIQTLPKRGYRFLAPVEVLEAPPRSTGHLTNGTTPEPEAPGRRQHLRLWAILAALLVLVAAGWDLLKRTRTGSTASPVTTRRMLVVLPLQNLGAVPQDDYFSDGLTEEMIAQLGRLDPRRLGVIARGSSMLYKNRAADAATLGRELGVHYVVEGSVRRAGDRVRITVKLVQASDRTHVWSESYERDLKDILALQSEVARAVARGVQIAISPAAESRFLRSRPVDPEAYQLYLQGRYFWNQRDHEGLTKAIDYFSRALERAPDEPLPYVGLADAYIVLTDQGSTPAAEAMPKAKEAAMKALALDPELAEAHVSLAMIRGSFDWEWADAEAGFRRANALNPNYPTTHHWYAHLLRAHRRFDEAVEETRKAQALDPLSLIINSNVGTALFYAGRFAEAEAQLRRVIEMNERFAPAHWSLGRLKLRTGAAAEAIRHHERAVEVSQRDPAYLCSLGHAYGVAGRREDALRVFREVEQVAATRYVAALDLALVHLGVGNNEEALRLIERAVDEHFPGVRQLRVEERFAPLADDPRFVALCRRVGLS